MKDRPETPDLVATDATSPGVKFDPDKPELDALYTTARVAELFGVTTETVRDWIKADKLPAVRLGDTGQYRIKRRDLLAFANHKFGAVDPTPEGVTT